MAKKATPNASTQKASSAKASLPLLPLLMSLLISAGIGFGVYYWLDYSGSSESKAKANSISQQAANIVDEYFEDIAKQSNKVFLDPDIELAHAYPIVLPASGIPTNLNFSEQDYISRARIDPINTLPEITLSELPDPTDQNKTINTQALSLMKPLSSGEYLLIRWSLNPLKQKLEKITPADIQIELHQEDNPSSIKALSINSKKSQSLEKLPLKHDTWSVTASYDAPQQFLSPLYAGLATTGGLFFLGLSGLTLQSRRKAASANVQNTLPGMPSQVREPTLDMDTPTSDTVSMDAVNNTSTQDVAVDGGNVTANDALSSNADVTVESQVDTNELPLEPVSETLEPLPEPQTVDPLLQASTDAQTDSTAEKTAQPNQTDSEHDTPALADTELAEEMVFSFDETGADQSGMETPDIAQEQIDHDLDDELLSNLESEIKSDQVADSNAAMEFKAPEIPDVGELKVPTAPHTELHADAANELDDGNVIDFDGFNIPSAASSKSDIDSLDPEASDISRVFRSFDIRGLTSDLTDTHVEQVAKGLATAFIEKGQYHLVVGRDVRESSERIANTLITTLVNQGLRVVNIGIATTPLMAYAAKNSFGCGIIVTASHSPSDHNGFKWIINNDSPSSDQVAQVKEIVISQNFADPLGQGSVQDQSFDEAYANAINNDIMLADLPNIVIDTMHGATGKLAPDIMERAGCVVTTLHNNMDGNFSSGHPNPTQHERLNLLSQAVVKQGAAVGFAFDCDGDRVAVVDEMGTVVSSEQLLCLFAKILLETNPAADIIYDIKCSRYVANTITDFGGRPILRPTGAHILRSTLKSSEQAVLAGELSGHFMFNDERLGQYDDGIYAALRLLEWLTQTGAPLSIHLASLPKSVSTDDVYLSSESRVAATKQIDAIVSHWQETQQNEQNSYSAIMTNLDGFRLDFPNGFGILRPSNTSSAITVRFSADDANALAQIKTQMIEFIQPVNADLADQLADI